MKKNASALHETIADISYHAGLKGYYSGDSRADMNKFIFLAKEFEKKHKDVDWEETDLDYIIEIDKYCDEHFPSYEKLDFTPEAATTPWDNFEVSPVRLVKDEFLDGDEIREHVTDCEVCDEGHEDFWSVYLHQVEGGVQCVADVPSKEHAKKLVELIKNAVKTFHQNAKFSDDVETPNRNLLVMTTLYLISYRSTMQETTVGYAETTNLINQLNKILEDENENKQNQMGEWSDISSI